MLPVCSVSISFSLTSPTTAQLLWDEEEIELENKKEEGTVEGREEGEVEELDYDESMEDLDLHPVGNIDEGGGGEARKLSTKQDERRGTVNWDDPEGDEVVDRASNIDDENLLDTETEEQTVATESKNWHYDVNLHMKAVWKPGLLLYTYMCYLLTCISRASNATFL
jgi:hypothetical protein